MQGGSEVGEGGLKVISPLDGGGQEVILTLIQGGCNFILRPTLLILDPPLQIIIAQSLSIVSKIIKRFHQQTSLACKFCFSNTGHVIILQRTVSFKFRLLCAYVRIIYEKTKGQVPLGSLLGKQNIQARHVQTSNNQRLRSAGDNDRRSKRFCSSAVLCVNFTWQMVKTRMIRLRVMEGPKGRGLLLSPVII